MKTRVFGLAAGLVAALALGAQASEADRKLQKAFYAEAAEHDLVAAIAGYREVLAMPGVDAAIAAKANLRLGICLSAMGLRAEAAQHLRRAIEIGGGAIRAEAQKLLSEVEAFSPAKAMPAEPLLYLEFDSPGEKLKQLIDLMVHAKLDPPGPAGVFVKNPAFIEEIRKIRSVAATITGGEPGRPTGVAVIVVEKESALKTLLRVFIPVNVEKRTHRDVEIWQVRGPRGEVSVAFRGEDLIILGNPVAEVEAALDRLTDGVPSLAESPPFLLATARYREPGSLVAYTDGPKLLATLAAIHPPRPQDQVGAKMLELDRLGSLAVRAVFGKTLTVEGEARFRDGTPRFARILNTPKVDPSILAWLPADTAVAAAMSVGDGGAKWAEFIKFADEMYDEALRAGVAKGERPSVGVAQLEAGLGLSLGKDVLGNIETVAIGVRTPGRDREDPPVIAMGVKDAAAAEKTAKLFLERLGQHVTGAPVAVERDASAALAVDKVHLSPALEPACAVAGRTLVLGPTPARVRDAIAAKEAGTRIQGDVEIPEQAVKLMVVRPEAMGKALTGKDAEGWKLLAEAAGGSPVLVWTEEEEGRIAVKARVPNLPDILVKIAERKARR